MKSKISLILFLFLLGCAATPMRTPNVTDLSMMLPERIMIEKIRITKAQAFRDCAPTALEAVFDFWGESIARTEIEKARKNWAGMAIRDMKDFIREQGFDYLTYSDRTEDKRYLKFLLAQGLPVLAIGSSYVGPDTHIVVIRGYDDQKKIFSIADPTRRGVQTENYMAFQEWHSRGGGWICTVYPRGRKIETFWGPGGNQNVNKSSGGAKTKGLALPRLAP